MHCSCDSNYHRNPTEVFYPLQGKSDAELAIGMLLEQYFQVWGVSETLKIKTGKGLVAVDLYIPELRLDVEIDGSYPHQDKEEKDIDNTLALQEAGVTVLRIREQPLKLLSHYYTFNEILIKRLRVENAPQILKIILDWIRRTYGFQPRLQPLAKEYQCNNPDFSCGKRGPASLFAYPGKCLDCYRYCPGYGGPPHLAAIRANRLCNKCYNRKKVAEPTDMCDGYGEPPHLAAINANRLCNKCYNRKRVAEPTSMCDGYGEQPRHLAAIRADRLCNKCYRRKKVAEPTDMCDGYGEQPRHLAAINANRLCNKCHRRKKVAEPTDTCDGYGEQPRHLAAIQANRLCSKCYHRKKVAEPTRMCNGYGEPPHLAAINADGLCHKCYHRKKVAEPTDTCDGYGEPPHLAAIKANRLCNKCYIRKRVAERRLTGKTETKLRRFYRKI